jgi:hypothetical protein
MSATAASTSATPAVGSGPNVVRWTGAVGLAALVVFLLATPLYFIGPARPGPARLGPARPSRAVRQTSTNPCRQPSLC